MAGMKPIGSEKLQGNDKLRRIMEIANYNFSTSNKSDDNSSTEYRLKLADGNSYEIVRERQGYIIKKNITESLTDYIEPMKSRRYYNSYSQALKRLNLMSKEINELYGNENGLELFGEAKSFKLKVQKPKAELAEPAAAPTLPTPEPAPAPTTTPDMGTSTEGGAEMGGTEPSSDLGSTEDAPMPDESGEEMPTDDTEDDMPTDDMDDEDEGSVKDPFKMIQKLVGKLTQKIRKFPKDEEMTAENVKYIINSILSALDLTLLDEDDVEEIMGKFEDEEEGDEENLPDQEGNIEDEGPIEDQEPTEPEGEVTEYGYRNRLRKRVGGGMETSEDYNMFNESIVDAIIESYFNPEAEKMMKEEREEKNRKFLQENYKNNRFEIERLSESTSQLRRALEFVKAYPQSEVVGTTNKKNMVIKLGLDQYKITPKGKLI